MLRDSRTVSASVRRAVVYTGCRIAHNGLPDANSHGKRSNVLNIVTALVQIVLNIQRNSRFHSRITCVLAVDRRKTWGVHRSLNIHTLWGVFRNWEWAGQVGNDACSFTPIRLSIKTCPSEAPAVCQAAETCPSAGWAARLPQWLRASRSDQLERRLRSCSDCCAPTTRKLSGCHAWPATHHCTGVPKNMRRDLLGVQRWTLTVSRFGVTLKDIRDAPAAERLPSIIHEHLWCFDWPTNG